MTSSVVACVCLVVTVSLTAAGGGQGIDDPALRAAVDRFFATQEAEDIEAYLALWSRTAQRPRPEQLKFIFTTGDDKYSGISLISAVSSGDRVRVRVSATRDRSSPSRIPGGPPLNTHSTTTWSLSYVREDGEWKLLREGSVVDGLADGLLEARTAEERERLLQEEPDLVNDALIMALSRRAGQAAQMRVYPEAQAGYERMREIARRVGNQRLEGEALQNLANTMYFQRNLAGALQAYEERLVIERLREDSEAIAAALLGIATIRYSFAEYGAALTSYREALAIQERLAEGGYIASTQIASTLISTGNVLYLQGDFAAAIADYSRSRDISRKIENTIGEADALEGLGRVFLAQGDYAAALDAFMGVLAEGKARNSKPDQGAALMSIGDLHFRLGNLDNARAALDQSRTLFEETKDLASAGRAWQAIALTDLAAGRFTPAEDEYRKSSASCAAAADNECVAGATVGLAFAQTAQDRFPEGIATYKKAIAAFGALKRREQLARAEVGLSQALAGNSEDKAAVEAAARARREGEALANDDVVWRALVAEASALRSLREHSQATRAALSAVATVDRLLEAAKVRPGAPVSRDSSSAFGLLALLQAEAGDSAAAFETAERMRTHDLRVVLASGERDISRGMTDGEREEERTLAVELVSLHAQLSREKSLPKPDGARVARLDKSIAEAAQKRAAQHQRVFERLPALRIWRGLMPAATRSDLAAFLTDSDTAIVQFVVGEQTLLVIVARRTEQGVTFTTHVEATSRKVLAERVAALMKVDTLSDVAAWRRGAGEFIPGLAALFGSATRAIVIPHEVLWRVPFEALPVGTGYLSDTAAIAYAPSVTALMRAPVPDAATAPRKTPAPDVVFAPSNVVVAVEVPELAASAVDLLKLTAPGWTLRSPASANQEVTAISATAQPDRTQAIGGLDATEAALRERLPSADFIHVAAPFRINSASPLFSPIILAADAAHDGALEAREVMNLNLNARATIVSDGAALTMRDAADEVGVVAWAWRAAGVPVVILPRWGADDGSSSELVVELYARLRSGDAATVALQSARNKIRTRSGMLAPYRWASWMVLGER